MILLGGVLATIFIFFCPGIFIVAKRDIPFSSKILGTVIYSIVIAWFSFFVALFLNLNVFVLYLLSIGYIGLLVIYLYSNLQCTNNKSVEIRSDDFIKGFFITALFIAVLFLSGAMYPLLKNIGSVFTGWDPVVSWNRWGMELSKNEYNPFKAAYPILYPALWSVIYKFQNTSEVWLITKATLSIVPIAFLLYCFLATLETKSVFFIILVFFVGKTFGGGDAMVSGHMDAPVALMAVIACSLYWHAEKTKNNESHNLVMMSWLAAGLASITKQPGVLVLFLLSALVFQRYGKGLFKDRKITGYFILVISLPISYLIIFSVFGDLTKVAGNLGRLENLTQQRSGGAAFVSAYYAFIAYLGLPMSISMMLGSFLNIFGRKLGASCRIGLYSLVAGVLGFLIWALYFSYDIRNSLWVIGLFCVSSATGYAALCDMFIIGISKRYFQIKDKNSINIKYVTKIACSELFRKSFSLLPLIFIPICLMTPDRVLTIRQSKEQLNVGIPKVNQLVLRNKDKIDSDAVVMTHYLLYKYIPGAPGRYAWDRCDDVQKLKKSSNFHNGSYILVAIWINKNIRKFLENLIENNQAELVDSWKDWRLIKLTSYHNDSL